MGLRNRKIVKINDWLGLQTFGSDVNLKPEWWFAANNVIVSNDGSAAVLRSPANFNAVLATSNRVLSAFDYAKTSGHQILFDINIGSISASSVRTYSTTGTSNTTVRSNQAAARWKRLNINDFAYGLNGTEFVQTDGTNNYKVGITPPAAAPSIAFTSGGAGTVASGVTVSYAYRNSTTGHVSQASEASSASGPASTNLKLRIAVVASTEVGVDGIVLFISADGGSVRYLYIDANADVVINANATANIDISLALLVNLDTLTPETAYNSIPPTNAYFMFKWADRICLCDFRGATTKQQIQYNSYETVFYGIPWESWWPLNIINISNKSDAARSGIETPLGALVLAEHDAYLIRGSLTDKVSGPESTVSITEHIQPMGWSIGTRSPYSLVTTPFGEIWLDQNKRIQLWKRDGFPVEAGLPIRTSLNGISDSFAGRNMAEAVWFQHGDQGGYYVLAASSNGEVNDLMYILSVYRDPEKGDIRFACAASDIAAQCLVVADVSGDSRLFIGEVDRLREIAASDTQGAGWGVTQTRYFKSIFGNDDTFAYWHSLQFDVTSTAGLTVTIANLDGTETQVLELEQDTGAGGAWYGLLDSYGYRKVISFTFSPDDTTYRAVQNLRVAYAPMARLM